MLNLHEAIHPPSSARTEPARLRRIIKMLAKTGGTDRLPR